MVLTSLASSVAFAQSYKADVDKMGSAVANDKHKKSFTLVLTMILLELALLFYALYLAYSCNEEDKLVHLLVAFFFPLGYVLYAKLFKKC